ncbi:MAG: hypothetical protein QM501_08660 [Gimesia sp.]
MRNRTLAMSGGRLTEQEASSLEKRVEQNPQDVDARLQLLGFYFRKQVGDSAAQKTNQEHIVWFIQNEPEFDVLATPFGLLYEKVNAIGYSQGKEAWLDQLRTDPENLKLLENSAKYFMLSNSELAEESLLKGRALDSDNPKWPVALGQLYSLKMKTLSGDEEQSTAEKALGQLEIAYRLSAKMGQDSLLSELAKVALVAQETTKAREYAELMLSKDDSHENRGNNIHDGNITLGKIAIAAGDVETAKSSLINAGKTPGSPPLDSFGPDMALAKELLKHGEKDAVLEYLRLCSTFWKSGRDRLVSWIEMIQNDQTPTDW